MEQKHRRVLNSHRVQIIEGIFPVYILQHLLQDGIINQEMEQDILAGRTKFEQARKLLDILPTRGPRAYGAFLKALKEQYPWLRDILLKAESSYEAELAVAIQASEPDENSEVVRVTDHGHSSTDRQPPGGEPSTPVCACASNIAPPRDDIRSTRCYANTATACGGETEKVDDQISQRLARIHVTPDKLVTEQQLLTVAENMGEEWEDVAIKLGFQKKDIFRFKNDESTVTQQIFSMLVKWKQNRGRNATVANLCSELKEAGVDSSVYDTM